MLQQVAKLHVTGCSNPLQLRVHRVYRVDVFWYARRRLVLVAAMHRGLMSICLLSIDTPTYTASCCHHTASPYTATLPKPSVKNIQECIVVQALSEHDCERSGAWAEYRRSALKHLWRPFSAPLLLIRFAARSAPFYAPLTCSGCDVEAYWKHCFYNVTCS